MRFLLNLNRGARSCGVAYLFAASLTVAAGCENAVSISGTVIVPTEVQQLFSAERPGVVVMRASKAGGGSALRYLCAPHDQGLTLPYVIYQLGCVEEQLVEARAFPVRPEALAQVRCDEPGEGGGGGDLRGEELAYGAASIFQGEHGGPCSSGSATADVTMAVGPAP